MTSKMNFPSLPIRTLADVQLVTKLNLFYLWNIENRPCTVSKCSTNILGGNQQIKVDWKNYSSVLIGGFVCIRSSSEVKFLHVMVMFTVTL